MIQCPAGTILLQSKKTPIEIPRNRIAAFCKRWQVTELALFGSVLRDDFGPESDVDVLAGFGEAARHTLFDLDDMELELKEIFGREVDLVSRRGVEASSNYLRRNSILQSAQSIHESWKVEETPATRDRP